MKLWEFKTPPEEMTEEQLRREFNALIDAPASDFDTSAMKRVLDALDVFDPHPPIADTEDSFTQICAKYPEIFGTEGI